MNEYSRLYSEKVNSSLTEICGILSGKSICVCLSGGADSVALLTVLEKLKVNLNYILSAAHVNHLLRGDEAERDEKFCKEFCSRLGIKLYTVSIDINKLSKENKKSIEETARDARYSFFEKIGKQNNIDYFATAHTKNDNAETIYMNIIRGTTTSGLCGIPRKNKNIIRPLLNISRDENIAFLSDNGFSYVTDSSNADNIHTRNYIRNIILPAVKSLNPQAIDAADRLSAYARSDEDFFEAALKSISECKKDIDLHPALLRRKLQQEYIKLSHGKSLMTVHLDLLTKLLYSGKSKSLTMPYGVTAIVKDGTASFAFTKCIKKIIDNGIYSLQYGENSFADNAVTVILQKSINNNNSVAEVNIYNNYTYIKLSFDKIVGSIKYRARQNGDKIFCLGVNKSIKKEFIAKGVPVHLREAIPVFFDEIGIVYVPYIGAADRVFAVDNNEKTIIIAVRFNERQD